MKQAEDNKTIDMFDEMLGEKHRLIHLEMMYAIHELILTKKITEVNDAEVPSRS